jgi:hypothetical protein
MATGATFLKNGISTCRVAGRCRHNQQSRPKGNRDCEQSHIALLSIFISVDLKKQTAVNRYYCLVSCLISLYNHNLFMIIAPANLIHQTNIQSILLRNAALRVRGEHANASCRPKKYLINVMVMRRWNFFLFLAFGRTLNL